MSPTLPTLEPSTAAGTPLPALLEPEAYSPNTFDYESTVPDRPGLSAWLEVFRKSQPTFTDYAASDPTVLDAPTKAAYFNARFAEALEALEADPRADLGPLGPPQRVTCSRLVQIRDQCLSEAGFTDIFATVKREENDKALELMPAILTQLDAVTEEPERLAAAVRGVFAGNMFDLGAAGSTELFQAGTGFEATRESLLSRPWAVDDLDALLERLRGAPHRLAVAFVDNAGSDVLLGMLPFCRELLKRGTHVIIASNRRPNINDITHKELVPLMQRVAAADPVYRDALSEGRCRLMCSGSDSCLIDLRCVSQELADATRGADLVILEGMGRSIETNLYATFACDSLKLGMIKHPEVATCLEARLYDCVVKFQPGGSAA